MASTPDFKYAPMFQLGEDTTESVSYTHLTLPTTERV